MRIYSNYSQEDYDVVIELAEQLGFSPSAFQRYCVMLYADKRGNTTPLTSLKSKMLSNIKQKESGETFIVSSLVPDEWPSLSRSDKMSLAKQLALHVRNNPQRYKISSVSKGKTNIYVVV